MQTDFKYVGKTVTVKRHPILSKWTIYPITFENKKYVVEITKGLLDAHISIYHYDKKKNKKTGFHLYYEEVYKIKDAPFITFHNEDREFDDFVKHIDTYITAIFEDFSKRNKQPLKQNKKDKFYILETWDGHVKI